MAGSTLGPTLEYRERLVPKYKPNRQADALGWLLVVLLCIFGALAGLREGLS
jgi:hypothetical protein